MIYIIYTYRWYILYMTMNVSIIYMNYVYNICLNISFPIPLPVTVVCVLWHAMKMSPKLFCIKVAYRCEGRASTNMQMTSGAEHKTSRDPCSCQQPTEEHCGLCGSPGLVHSCMVASHPRLEREDETRKSLCAAWRGMAGH